VVCFPAAGGLDVLSYWSTEEKAYAMCSSLGPLICDFHNLHSLMLRILKYHDLQTAIWNHRLGQKYMTGSWSRINGVRGKRENECVRVKARDDNNLVLSYVHMDTM
jgi:hypothetical protein